jgi:hypothetical protein
MAAQINRATTALPVRMTMTSNDDHGRDVHVRKVLPAPADF